MNSWTFQQYRISVESSVYIRKLGDVFYSLCDFISTRHHQVGLKIWLRQIVTASSMFFELHCDCHNMVCLQYVLILKCIHTLARFNCYNMICLHYVLILKCNHYFHTSVVIAIQFSCYNMVILHYKIISQYNSYFFQYVLILKCKLSLSQEYFNYIQAMILQITAN